MAVMSTVTYRKKLTSYARTINGPTRRAPCIFGEGKNKKEKGIKDKDKEKGIRKKGYEKGKKE
jgi:hypothetical protein